MNSVLAVLTALVMIFAGFAEVTSKMEAPLTVEESASIQMDAVNAMVDEVIEARAADVDPEYREAYIGIMQEQTQKARGMASLAAALINQVTARFVVDKGYVEAGLYTNGDALANGAALVDEKGITLVSNLLGNTALTISGADAQEITKTGLAELKEMLSGLTGIDGSDIASEGLPQLDPQELTAVLNAVSSELLQGIMSKMGVPETGPFTVDGMEFAVRMPFNISEKEAKLMALNAVKKALESEAAQKLLKMIPRAEQLTQKIDEKVAEVEFWADDRPIYAFVYITADQKGSYFHIQRHNSENAASLGLGTVGDQMILNASTGTNHRNIHLTVTIGKDGLIAHAEKTRSSGRTATFDLQINAEGLKADAELPLRTGKSLYASAQADNTGMRETLRYGETELASQTIRVLFGEKAVRLTDGEAESFDLAGLLKDESGATLKALTTKLTGGAFTLLAKVMALVGTEENAQTLVNLIPTGAFATPSSSN